MHNDQPIHPIDNQEKYRQVLQKEHWELREAVYLLCGVIEFVGYYSYYLENELVIGKKFFPLIPKGYSRLFGSTNEEIKDLNNKTQKFDEYLQIMYQSIQLGEIEANLIKTRFISFEGDSEKKYPLLKGQTYLLSPKDVIANAVTNGITLPIDLQVVTSLFSNANDNHLSLGKINETKRNAVARVIVYFHPNKNKSEITRIMASIKNRYPKQYSFINTCDFSNDKRGTSNRIRKAVTRVKSSDSQGNVLEIPGVIERDGEGIYFDFQRMEIALSIVANLLVIKYNDISSKEILLHPLVSYYADIGGEAVKQIIEFALKGFLNDLDQVQQAEKPSN